jgi:FdhD protein
MKGPVTHVSIRKWNTESASLSDLVAVEEPLEIRLGFGLHSREQRSLSVTMRTPGHDFELALGFLFTEGIIQRADQVESVKYCEDVGRQDESGNVVRVELRPEVILDWKKIQRNFYTTSSCGVCGKSSIDSIRTLLPVRSTNTQLISPEVIAALPGKLRQAQLIFEHTGGLHATGIFNLQGELILIREDVGRHNGMDKAIGAMLLRSDLSATDCIVLVSGRASFELVQKAALAGFPVMAAVGAPSSLAVSLAKEAGTTLIGFLRDANFNVYNGEERLLL